MHFESVESIGNTVRVVTIEDLKAGVLEDKPAQNGGIAMHFATPAQRVRLGIRKLGVRACDSAAAHSVGSSQGYWKPCYGNTGSSETYFSEISSFHLDRLLGFYRTPAVVPRYFPSEQLQQLANDAAPSTPINGTDPRESVRSILENCGVSYNRTKRPTIKKPLDSVRGAEGAMVGWSPVPFIELLTNRTYAIADLLHPWETPDKGRYWAHKFRVNRNSPKKDIAWVLESMYFNMYGAW